MSENESSKSEAPNVVKTIEDVLEGIVAFVIGFPTVTFTLLLQPSKIASDKLPIKSLVYFSVCFLLTTKFWHTWYLKTDGFVSPIVGYLLNPDFSSFVQLFFEHDSLFHSLLSLIPIVICIIFLCRLMEYILFKKSKDTNFINLSFYTLGLSLLSVPLAAFLYLGLGNGLIECPKGETISENLSIAVFIAISIAILRLIWTGVSIIMDKRFGGIGRKIIATTVVVTMGYYVTKAPGLIYSERFNVGCQIINVGSLNGLNKENPGDTLILKASLTNYSDNDKLVSMKSLTLHVNSDGNGLTLRPDSTSILHNQEKLTNEFVLQNHSTILLKCAFYLSPQDIAKLRKLFQDKELPDGGYVPGTANFSLEINRDVERGQLKVELFDLTHEPE